MIYVGRSFTSMKMLAMYSPIIPINRMVIPLKKVIADIREAHPTIVESFIYAINVHIINIKLNKEIKTPDRVIK